MTSALSPSSIAAPTAGAGFRYHDRPHAGQVTPPLGRGPSSFVPSAGQKRKGSVGHARQWIGAATAAEDVADLLEIPAVVPVLKIRRVTCVAGEEPAEVVEAYFHPERYQHYNELSVNPVELGV